MARSMDILTSTRELGVDICPDGAVVGVNNTTGTKIKIGMIDGVSGEEEEVDAIDNCIVVCQNIVFPSVALLHSYIDYVSNCPDLAC